VIGTVKNWIADFFSYANLINRLDKTEPADYLQELRDFFDIQSYLGMVTENLQQLELQTSGFKAKFYEYKYLWEENPE